MHLVKRSKFFPHWSLRATQPQHFVLAHRTSYELPLVKWAFNPVRRLLVIPMTVNTVILYKWAYFQACQYFNIRVNGQIAMFSPAAYVISSGTMKTIQQCSSFQFSSSLITLCPTVKACGVFSNRAYRLVRT